MSAPGPTRRRDGDAPWVNLGVDGTAEVETLVGPERSPLGAGFARFEHTEFDWTLAYDEVIHVLVGRMEIDWEGGGVVGEAGDVIHIPKGSAVTYRVPGSCRIFFATYPADWEGS